MLCLVGAGILLTGRVAAQDSPRKLPRGLLTQPMLSPAKEKTLTFSREPLQARQQEITQVQATGERERHGRPRKEGDDVEAPTYGDMPGADRMFRRESEEEWKERIRQDERRRPGSDKVEFPQETAAITKQVYAPRFFPPASVTAEPCYVSHCRLNFEQPNFERLGYDFAFFQPGVSLGIFYWDLLTAPYQMCKRPCQQYDTSAGKPLPGDDAPFLLYPPEWSLTGLAGQCGAATGIVLGFP